MHTNTDSKRPYDDVDLREYARVLWQARFLIVMAAAVCAAVAFTLSMIAPRMYEAEASLAVSRPKLSESLDSTSVANFRPFIASRSVAVQVIKELGFDKPPYNFDATSFFGSVVTVEEVKNSTILLVKGTLNDPALVTRAVNRVAELGVDAARRSGQTEALRARDDIKLQRDESRVRLEQAEKSLQDFREASQIEVLKKDVDAALLERSGLLRLLIGIEADKSKLAKAERELLARQKLDTVKRSIDTDPVLLESARSNGNGRTGDLLGLQLRSEVVNPVYEMLDKDVAKTRSELAGKERQKAQMGARKLDAPHLAVLSTLYQAESALARLEMERDLARKIYLEVSTTYETARLTVAGRSSALQVVTPADMPDRTVPRGVVKSAALAFCVGLLTAAAGVLLYSAFSPSFVVSRASHTG
jgi:uncharacterized protein involved in exopolysaccharide biosynthesis